MKSSAALHLDAFSWARRVWMDLFHVIRWTADARPGQVTLYPAGYSPGQA